MAVLITVLTCPCPPFTSLMLSWERGRRFLSPEGGRASPHMAWAGTYYPCYGHWAGLLPPGMWCLARQQALRLRSLLSHMINFFVPSEPDFFFVERAQSYIAADMGSVLAQVPPQMHRPSLSLLSCSSKGLVGLQGKTVRVATFLCPKT